MYTGCYPNKNSFERSLKHFQTSEKGFGQQPVHTQKPLTEEELVFIARHPEIARKIMTVSS